MEIRFVDCGIRYGETVALQPLDLDLAERRIGVIGLNGSGKTTFARAINGLVKPSQGRVTVNGRDTVADGAEVLGRVGFIFQNPQNQLILPIVADDIALGLKSRGVGKADVAARVEAILARFGIEHLARRRVHALSGGETQLVAMASVLVTEPDILILDEPTNQLDLRNRKRVVDTLAGLDEAAIVVSHDLSLIESFERVLLFHEGRLIADGIPGDVVKAYEAVALS
ncbi:energy-coupling factor ABC transporter ATP-binding protein [Rhizobium sp. DKSPLA3]|uniref:Energy-coupling factor ABC transporter ATP-binding protein n=1 Tax=Rhizobium quercicola TaxID=2901226 RepID=A0A9X1NW10_9HYPH|nr:ABC transporter ATP-binding protein [Rhizobium quercicola]MCD7110924.1 energy-coupling factor ABC transporter ATP-binding protein [Rhizobium quercicola]